ncbi:MAG: SPOR domain-containing protein [Hyphomicrobiaceae bacterium]
MARDWRSLALAVFAAAALTLTGALGAEAQTNPKAAPKAAPKQPQKAAEPADDDEPEELKPEAKPKAKKQDPVEAQRAIEGTIKLLDNGKADQAVQALTNTISGGNLPPAIMAKALLYRGMAYRRQQKPAQAISDISGALWLKGGLSPTDRTSALQQRAAAYQEAGLTENGEPLAPARSGGSGATQAKELSATSTASQSSQSGSSWGGLFGGGSWGSQTKQAQPEKDVAPSASQSSQSGSGWGNWFGGGSSASSSTAQVQPKQEVAPFATTVKSEPEAKSSSISSWSSGTEVRSAPAQARIPAGRIETAAITPARPEGRFSVQVAMVRSQDEARALVAKVKRDYAGALASREPEIDQAVVGNMGTLYRVKFGPFATQNEGQAACARLKGSGLDCMVVTQ